MEDIKDLVNELHAKVSEGGCFTDEVAMDEVKDLIIKLAYKIDDYDGTK